MSVARDCGSTAGIQLLGVPESGVQVGADRGHIPVLGASWSVLQTQDNFRAPLPQTSSGQMASAEYRATPTALACDYE